MTLEKTIASTILTLKKKRRKKWKITVSIGDLTAVSENDEPIDNLPFDGDAYYWSAKAELSDGYNAPFVKMVQAADSIQALFFALQYAGIYMTKLYGPAETYDDMLPNYGFPKFTD